MSNIELIKELRNITSAGMADCKAALQEAGDDLQAAIDIIKIKGKNISDGRSGKTASEGIIEMVCSDKFGAIIEINSNTDFVAKSRDFLEFSGKALEKLITQHQAGATFQTADVETERVALVAKTHENIVVRRWWIEEAQNPTVKVFSYLHSNSKIGVLITMQAPSEEAANNPLFKQLGEDLAMQVCAMNPIAISPDNISTAAMERQKAIFETQLKEDAKPKPQAMWPKIIDGKLGKWFRDVCLLEQESVIVPKTTVKNVIDGVGTILGGQITVINYVRAMVGEGIEKQTGDFAEEVQKLSGVSTIAACYPSFARVPRPEGRG